ncbi:uncharacterized [Tachysurus ichikawai]
MRPKLCQITSTADLVSTSPSLQCTRVKAQHKKHRQFIIPSSHCHRLLVVVYLSEWDITVQIIISPTLSTESDNSHEALEKYNGTSAEEKLLICTSRSRIAG